MFMQLTRAVDWLHGNGLVSQEDQSLPLSCRSWWTGHAQNSFLININQNGQKWRNFLPRLQSQKAACRRFLNAWGQLSRSGRSMAQKRTGSWTTWWRWQRAWEAPSSLWRAGLCARAAPLAWGNAGWLCRKSWGSRERRRCDLKTKITSATTRSSFRTPEWRWSPRRRSAGPACSPSAWPCPRWAQWPPGKQACCPSTCSDGAASGRDLSSPKSVSARLLLPPSSQKRRGGGAAQRTTPTCRFPNGDTRSSKRSGGRQRNRRRTGQQRLRSQGKSLLPRAGPDLKAV